MRDWDSQGGILHDCVISSNVAIPISLWDKAWVAVKEWGEVTWISVLIAETSDRKILIILVIVLGFLFCV